MGIIFHSPGIKITIKKLACHLKGLFHPACLARVISWFAFVAAISWAISIDEIDLGQVYENDDNNGKPRDGTCKACWMKQTL